MLLRFLNELIRLRRKNNGRVRDTAARGARADGEEDRDPVDAWLLRGRALEQSGQLTAAVECYRACATAHPTAVNAHLAAASALAQLWRVEECLEALDRARAAA